MTAPVGLLSKGPTTSQHDKLREAARQLEAVFYGQLLQAMRATVPEGGALDRSSGEETFTSMLDDRIAQLASGQNDRGLASAMYRQLSKQLSDEPASAAPNIHTPGGGLDGHR